MLQSVGPIWRVSRPQGAVNNQRPSADQPGACPMTIMILATLLTLSFTAVYRTRQQGLRLGPVSAKSRPD